MCCRRLCFDIGYAGRVVKADFWGSRLSDAQTGRSSGACRVGCFLDPLTETSMRPALLLGDGSFAIFSNWPMAAPITIITLLLLAMPLFNLFRQRPGSSAGT